MNVTPHVAAKVTGSAIDGRTTRHAGYAVSQRIRKRIEEVFGWGKTVGPIAQTTASAAPSGSVRTSPSRWRATISPGCRSCSLHDKGMETLASRSHVEAERSSTGAAFSAAC
jgi:hypothetical protein